MKGNNNKFTIAILIIFFAIMMTVFYFTGITSISSGTKIGFFETKGINEWSARYYSFSGYTKRNIKIDSDKNIINVDIKTTSGNIDLEIKDKDDKILYSDKNISTSSFEVEAKGELFIKITSKKHKGSYSIKW